MQKNYNTLFPGLPDHSRVWIYISNREFTLSEVETVTSTIHQFVRSWKAHQKSLTAAGTLLLNRCVVLAVNEDDEQITGCSIDGSVKLIKEMEQHYNVDFFNRLNMLISCNGDTKMVSYHDLKNHREDYIYNPNIETLKEIRENWLIPIKDSPFV
mgnify:FL=1|tara:strand:- start:1260 stop:1724 length:465 start_codon:yes stop_codon:yes gene_type:complete